MTGDDLKIRLSALETQLKSTIAALKVQIESGPAKADGDLNEKSTIDESLVKALLAAQEAKYEAQLAELQAQLEKQQSRELDKRLEGYLNDYEQKLSDLGAAVLTNITDIKSKLEININNHKTISDRVAVIEQLKGELDALKLQIKNGLSEIKINVQENEKNGDEKYANLLAAIEKKLNSLKLESAEAVADVQKNIDIKFSTFKTSDDVEVKSEEIVAMGIKLDELRNKMNELLSGVRSEFTARIDEQVDSNDKKLIAQLQEFESKLDLLKTELNKKQTDEKSNTDERLEAHIKMVNDKLDQFDSDLQSKLDAYLDRKLEFHDEKTRKEIKEQILQTVSNTYKNYTFNEQKVHVDVSPGTVKGGITEKVNINR